MKEIKILLAVFIGILLSALVIFQTYSFYSINIKEKLREQEVKHNQAIQQYYKQGYIQGQQDVVRQLRSQRRGI